MLKGATIDSTGQYRYKLWRVWDSEAPRVVFVMLNPSTADALVDDPTIRRCIGFAQTWGCGALEVLNLFAYRATSPHILSTVADPVGSDNDAHLLETRQKAGHIVLAWGNRGALLGRNQTVLKQLVNVDNVYCLGLTAGGHPCHPLYLKAHTKPVPYREIIKL
jgi:hypothetical protein